jgi:hypothetical protein
VREWVLTRAPDQYRRNLGTANTVRLADDYFRTCIADDSRRRFLCLLVDTRSDPPKVVRDPSMLPNENRD